MRHFLCWLSLLCLLVGCRATPSQNPQPMASAPAPVTPRAQTPTPAPDLEDSLVPPKLSDKEVKVTAHLDPLQGWDLAALQALPKIGQQFVNLGVAQRVRTYESKDFAPFLPPEEMGLGDLYEIPKEEAGKFLTQFFPDVRARMNIDGSGAYGALRALSKDRAEIALRVHAQFRFDGDVFLSPAQFAGSLIVNRKNGDIESFRLGVPTHYRKNIAFEEIGGGWLSGLTFTSRMELTAGNTELSASTSWENQADWDKVFTEMGREFYAFEEIDWVELGEVQKRASDTQKPVFAVMIVGALTDQSC